MATRTARTPYQVVVTMAQRGLPGTPDNGLVVVADDGPQSVTLGVAPYALVSEGVDPYPHIVIVVEVV